MTCYKDNFLSEQRVVSIARFCFSSYVTQILILIYSINTQVKLFSLLVNLSSKGEQLNITSDYLFHIVSMLFLCNVQVFINWNQWKTLLVYSQCYSTNRTFPPTFQMGGYYTYQAFPPTFQRGGYYTEVSLRLFRWEVIVNSLLGFNAGHTELLGGYTWVLQLCILAYLCCVHIIAIKQ